MVQPNTISALIHIKGKVPVDIATGLFMCNVSLTNIPEQIDFEAFENVFITNDSFKENIITEIRKNYK
jgi:hypothetical protein